MIRVRLKEQTGHREDVELPAVPRVGDFIHRPSGPELKVVSVHWSVDPEVSADVVLLVVPSNHVGLPLKDAVLQHLDDGAPPQR